MGSGAMGRRSDDDDDADDTDDDGAGPGGDMSRERTGADGGARPLPFMGVPEEDDAGDDVAVAVRELAPGWCMLDVEPVPDALGGVATREPGREDGADGGSSQADTAGGGGGASPME